MQTAQTQRDAQEIFDNLHPFSPAQNDVDTDSISADIILQHKLESASHRCSSDKCREAFDKDEELAKLITFFANQGFQHAQKTSIKVNLSANALSVDLPPPVRYSRRSRKAVTKQLVCISTRN